MKIKNPAVFVMLAWITMLVLLTIVLVAANKDHVYHLSNDAICDAS